MLRLKIQPNVVNDDRRTRAGVQQHVEQLPFSAAATEAKAELAKTYLHVLFP